MRGVSFCRCHLYRERGVCHGGDIKFERRGPVSVVWRAYAEKLVVEFLEVGNPGYSLGIPRLS